MGSFELLAAHYPFKDEYESYFQCSTLWGALKQFRKYQKEGYEIINIYYRRTIKVDTSNWNHITLG